MYDESLIMGNKALRATTSKVRNEMTISKEDWQYSLSSRCLYQAIEDLGKAWANFFDEVQPDWGKPKFKSKKESYQGFKTDRAKIVDGKLRLDKPRGVQNWYDIRFNGSKSLKGDLKIVSIYCKHCHLMLKSKLNVKHNVKQQLI